MIETGYLADLRAIQIHLETDFNALHTRRGDFIASEVEDVLLHANAPAHVVAAYRQHAAGRRTLVFTPSVHVAHVIADRFRQAGIPAEALDGTTPTDERRAILHRLHIGETLAVPNCAVLTEGFDEPRLECIVVARPTQSRLLYTQMVGRGTRPYPGKADCLILDLVGATGRHDLQTAATLFGLPPQALATGTVTAAAAAQREERRVQAAHGALVATRVELFKRRPISWVTVDPQHFLVNLGESGTLHLLEQDDRWRVEVEPWGATWPEILAEGLDLGYAQGIAEDHARKHARTLTDREAPWRRKPVTEKQLTQLRRLRIPIPLMCTSGQASDLLAPHFARVHRRPA